MEPEDWVLGRPIRVSHQARAAYKAVNDVVRRVLEITGGTAEVHGGRLPSPEAWIRRRKEIGVGKRCREGCGPRRDLGAAVNSWRRRRVPARVGDVQRVWRPIRQRRLTKRRRKSICWVPIAVVPVRQGPASVSAPQELDHGRPDNPLKPVEVHPVPRQEKPAGMLTLVPSGSCRRRRVAAVNASLECPARGVRHRATLHIGHCIGVGQRDRIPGSSRLQAPDVAADVDPSTAAAPVQCGVSAHEPCGPESRSRIGCCSPSPRLMRATKASWAVRCSLQQPTRRSPRLGTLP